MGVRVTAGSSSQGGEQAARGIWPWFAGGRSTAGHYNPVRGRRAHAADARGNRRRQGRGQMSGNISSRARCSEAGWPGGRPSPGSTSDSVILNPARHAPSAQQPGRLRLARRGLASQAAHGRRTGKVNQIDGWRLRQSLASARRGARLRSGRLQSRTRATASIWGENVRAADGQEPSPTPPCSSQILEAEGADANGTTDNRSLGAPDP